jgi:hypothetical protein
MVPTNKLPPELAGRLRRLIRRVRLLMLTRGLLAVAAVATGAILTVMAIDAAVVLAHPAARWAFSLAGLTLTVAAAWSMLVVPLARPLTLTRMARVLETRHPELQERISSALDLATCGGTDAEWASRELVALLTQEAKSDLADVSPRREFSVRTVKPFLLLAVAALLVLGVLLAVWPQQGWLLLMRALAPHREFDTLQASALQIEPGDVMLLAGKPLRFEVVAPERHGLRAEIHFQRTDGRKTVERMKRLSAPGADPVTYELDLPSVEEGFEYRVRYGNAWTRPYTILVVTAPCVRETRVAYTFPAYTGLAATQTVGVVQEIAAPAGTRVRIEAAFDRACAASFIVNDLALPNPGGTATNAVWLQTLTTNRTGRWTLALRDTHGFTNCPSWSAYTAWPDRPPVITLEHPEASRLSLPPYDRLVCTGRATDDYGFSALTLVIKAEKRPEISQPLSVSAPGAVSTEVSGGPDLQALYDSGVRTFTLCFRAADNQPPELGGPQVRESRAITVYLKTDACTLREQVREAAKKALEGQLRKAAQELNEAANRVAQEKWSYDRPELTERAAAKLEQARGDVLQAAERLSQTAEQSEKTPFEAFAEAILDTRDTKVEPAFQKLEQIPLATSETRKQTGEEAERALREAAEKVNDLVNRALQEESRQQEALSRLAEVAQREQALAQEATDAPLDRQQMQQWVNRQNEAEQKMWQAKPQVEEPTFNAALEEIRQARQAMLTAQQALTPEQEQALKRQAAAQAKAEEAARLAQEAAREALEANVQAEAAAENRAVTEALQQAAEQSAHAAEQAQEAAQTAEKAAEQRAANEAVADAAERQAIAERAARAAEQAAQAAEQVGEGTEQARQATEARQAGQQDQANAAQEKSGQAADAATEQAAQANAEAVEAAREAAEHAGMEQAQEAAQLASESATMTQRAAELAREATQAAEQAAALPEEQRGAAFNEAQGLAEQSKQVADEAREKATQAAEQARQQLEKLAQEAQAAAARQAPSEAVAEQAREAVQQAQEAATQAQKAVAAAADAVEASQAAGPLSQVLAEQLAEAAELAGQAAELAETSGERTAQAEAQQMSEAQERAATSQALEEARQAARLAAEAAALAQQSTQQATDRLDGMKQAAAEAAKSAAQRATEAAREAQQAGRLAENAKNPDLQEAARQGGEAATLSGEAAALAEQALQTLEQATAATDDQAQNQAREGQAKARQALELAQHAEQQADAQTEPVNAQQLAAAEKADAAAERLAAVLGTHQERQAAAWAQAQARLDGVARRAVTGRGAGGQDAARHIPLNPAWIRFRGELGSEAYAEMLKKTPAEYRELVKRYFEELAREGDGQK